MSTAGSLRWSGPKTRRVTPYYVALWQFRRELLRHVLAAHVGNRSAAARTLGLQRTHLHRLLRECGLTGGHGDE